MSITPSIIDTAGIPKAMSAKLAATALLGEESWFVHKWSSELRRYNLSDIEPPSKLHYLSRYEYPRTKPAIAIGGTRSPTVQAFKQAFDFAVSIARNGYLVVSGGVPGIDLAAHLGALESGRNICSTIAVLPNCVSGGLCGHSWSSRFIGESLVNSGGLLSEYDHSVCTNSDEFRERLLDRDRIISAISDIFVAFECSENSATVDTARRARLQGKSVYAAKPPLKSQRLGTRQLIDEGIAKPLQIETFLVELFAPGQDASLITSDAEFQRDVNRGLE